MSKIENSNVNSDVVDINDNNHIINNNIHNNSNNKNMSKQYLRSLCYNFVIGKCKRDNCKFFHDTSLCKQFSQNGSCKFKDNCRKKHVLLDNYNNNHKQNRSNNHDDRGKQNDQNNRNNQGENRDKGNGNKERKGNMRRGDDLMDTNVDLRVVVDSGNDRLKKFITSKDLLFVPNLFNNFKKGELISKITNEIKNCGISEQELLKLWHNDCHYIVDDKKNWKNKVPTFNFLIEKMKDFFNVRVEATRLNIYKDTSQFKYYHHDRASFHEKTAEKQNFTICLNLGTSRTIALRHEKTKTIISNRIDDGEIYCFSNQVNIDWEHAVLKEKEIINEPRMSIVIWGYINME